MSKLGKASWDGYDQGGWLTLKDLLKNWIAKDVASEVTDSTVESVYSTQQFLPKVPLIIKQSKV